MDGGDGVLDNEADDDASQDIFLHFVLLTLEGLVGSLKMAVHTFKGGLRNVWKPKGFPKCLFGQPTLRSGRLSQNAWEPEGFLKFSSEHSLSIPNLII